MTDVTMDKIVSLCRRRGFVFPSSEIYGGLGSTYDYGHYGVLMKNHIRERWFRAMVQEALDDPRPAIPNSKVKALFARRRAGALRKAGGA